MDRLAVLRRCRSRRRYARADDSDSWEMGQYLFDNHGTPAGHTVSIGEFEAGAILHFSYLVFHGN